MDTTCGHPVAPDLVVSSRIELDDVALTCMSVVSTSVSNHLPTYLPLPASINQLCGYTCDKEDRAQQACKLSYFGGSSLCVCVVL